MIRVLRSLIIATTVLTTLPAPVAGPGPEHRGPEGDRIGALVPGGVAATPRQRSSPVTHPAPPVPLEVPSPVPPGGGTSSPPPRRQSPAIPGVVGTATWYAYRPGEAAAGPSLRAFLGRSWRGRNVTVRSGSRSVTVRLTDWCACPGGRVIDLDRGSFGVLADPSRGILRVQVTP